MGHPTRKVPYKVIEDTLKDLGMSIERFALEGRISPSGVYNWKREGHAPAYAALICEALRARHAKQREAEVAVLFQLPPENTPVVELFAQKIGGRLSRTTPKPKNDLLLYSGDPEEAEVLAQFVKQLGGEAATNN